MTTAQCFEGLESRTYMSALTLVTHGFQTRDTPPSWLSQMVDALADRNDAIGESGAIARWMIPDAADRVSRASDAFGLMSQRGDGDRLIELNWAEASNNFINDGRNTNLMARLVDAELSRSTTTANWLEQPIHLIGHSRGGSLVSELAALLGQRGIWVEHLTLLDAYPSQIAQSDPDVRIVDTVIFAENVFTRNNQPGTLISGSARNGAANLDLTGTGAHHSQVQGWYLGTVDPTAVRYGEDAIATAWFNGALGTAREQAGFVTASTLPDAWARRASLDLGRGLDARFGGAAVGRVPIAPMGAQWPNVSRVEVLGSSRVMQGASLDVTFIGGDRDSAFDVRVFIDSDDNPYNANSREIGSFAYGRTELAQAAVRASTAGLPAGTFRIYAMATDGVRTRYSYATEAVTIEALPNSGEHVLFFPEGYRSATVNEYIPMVNPHGFAVSYQVIARYEFGPRDQVIASGVLPPTSRGGITTAEAIRPDLALVRSDVPYAIEIRSSAPIGAMLSHYDFGVATGESFTNVTSGVWTFPAVRKDPSRGPTFLVWYNASDQDIVVRVEARRAGQPDESREFALGARRRGGLSINDEPWLSNGSHAVTVSTTGALVAAMSLYDTPTGQGSISLGNPLTAARGGVAPITETQLSHGLVVQNLGATEASATVRVFDDVRGQVSSKTVSVPARRSIMLAGAGIGSISGRGMIRVDSTSPVTSLLLSSDSGRGDSLGLTGANVWRPRWLFADGYMATATAGSQNISFVSVLNPHSQAQSVDLTFYFLDGTTFRRSVQVQPNATWSTALHTEPGVLENARARGGQSWFAASVDAPRGVVAAMTHWDLAQQGGWATFGTSHS